MDVNSFLHAMPEVAQEAILKNGVNATPIGDGVNRLNMAGHDKGVAYAFKIHGEHNPSKSNERGYEVYDELEIIQWFIDRKNKPVALVQHLPPDLLKFNRQGEVVGGRYKEAYLAWKTGSQVEGTPLRRWGLMSDAEVKSLEDDGIFTVEQYVEVPRDRVTSRYPQSFVEAYDRAGQYLAAKDVRKVADKQAEENAALKKANEDLAERLAKLEAVLEQATEPKKAVNKLTEGKK